MQGNFGWEVLTGELVTVCAPHCISSLAFLLRPDDVLLKFRIYFFAGVPSAEAGNPLRYHE